MNKFTLTELDGFIVPDWPAPASVRAYTTTRQGGVSLPPFDSFNLASHVGDDNAHVQANRERLTRLLDLPSEPVWLSQVHQTDISFISSEDRAIKGQIPVADAATTRDVGRVCVVMTADCLPVFICDQQGRQVAVAHAGWRGLVDGVLQKTVEAFTCPGNELLAWLGPAIGPDAYEVGDEVRQVFIEQDATAEQAFKPGDSRNDRQHWWADLYTLARLALASKGVNAVYGGDHCTYHDSERFYSYRRDGKTGRMASLIWRQG